MKLMLWYVIKSTIDSRMLQIRLLTILLEHYLTLAARKTLKINIVNIYCCKSINLFIKLVYLIFYIQDKY